jgi:hypothetical protein
MFSATNSGASLLKPDPLDLGLREPLLGAVIELGGARALVRRHFLRVFKRAAISKVSGNAGRAKRVIADRRVNAGGPRVGLIHRPSDRWRCARGWSGTASPCGPPRRRPRRCRTLSCVRLVLKEGGRTVAMGLSDVDIRYYPVRSLRPVKT